MSDQLARPHGSVRREAEGWPVDFTPDGHDLQDATG
jgi:hypothetical protein